MQLWRKIRDGEVGESTLHKMSFCCSPNRHTLYQKADECETVIIHFRYLEGILIPFDESQNGGKCIGILPLGNEKVTAFYDVEEDERLFGFKYMIKRKSGGRYFQHENKKYYRLADVFRLCGETGNFLYIWYYCVKQTQSQMCLEVLKGRKQ